MFCFVVKSMPHCHAVVYCHQHHQILFGLSFGRACRAWSQDVTMSDMVTLKATWLLDQGNTRDAKEGSFADKLQEYVHTQCRATAIYCSYLGSLLAQDVRMWQQTEKDILKWHCWWSWCLHFMHTYVLICLVRTVGSACGRVIFQAHTLCVRT